MIIRVAVYFVLVLIALTRASKTPPPPPEFFDSEFIEDIVGPERLTEALKSDVWLIEFYINTCAYCKLFAPIYKTAAQQLDKQLNVKFHLSKFECTKTQNYQYCVDNKILTYPTIYLYVDGQRIEEYLQQRNVADFTQYVLAQQEKYLSSSKGLQKEVKAKEGPVMEPPSKNDLVVDITSENYVKVIGSHALNVVEFFSPDCHHCTKFRPIYEALALDLKSELDLFTHSGKQGVAFTRVDCLTSGSDLCELEEVSAYPFLKLLDSSGYIVDSYDGGSFQAEPIKEWLTSKLKSYNGATSEMSQSVSFAEMQKAYSVISELSNIEKQESQLTVKPLAGTKSITNGQVVQLSTIGFDQIAQESWLIAFTAPFCSHCAKLKPIWQEVASQLKDVVNVGDVDCSAYAALSKRFDIKGYPTIKFFYSGEEIAEFRGPRTLSQLVDFAKGLNQASFQPVNAVQLKEAVTDAAVVFVYLSQSGANKVAPYLEMEAKKNNQDAKFYISSDEAVLEQYGSRSSKYDRLVVIRDGTHLFYELKPDTKSSDIVSWIQTNKFALVTEMTFHNSATLFSLKRYIVLAIIKGSATEEDIQTLQQAAREFDKRADDNGTPSADFMFVWLDGVEWEKYVHGTFGLNAKALPVVLIITPNGEQYFDSAQDGQPILLSKQSIHQAMLDSQNGKLTSKRIGARGGFFSSALQMLSIVKERPLFGVFFITTICAIMYYLLKGSRISQESFLPIKAD